MSFNPRTHTGCDLQSEKHPLRIPFGFNPRTHTGCDTFSGSLDGIWAKFQSTHPHGVRRPYPPLCRGACSFNPRTHTGCDISYFTSQYCLFGFNPRTHTGCDFIRFRISISSSVSIHAPTRGATRHRQKNPLRICFNPRTHTGCDFITLSCLYLS